MNNNEFLSLLKNHQNLIVAGIPKTTSSGNNGDKNSTTSQLSKYLLEDMKNSAEGNRGGINYDNKMILCTEPKRNYVLSLAKLLSSENGTNVGDVVGYGIRFEEKISNETKIKFITDGLLIRELMQDPMLSNYSIIIIDNINERSLTTDLLLSLLNNLQKSKRSDLKLVMVSSSISTIQDINRLFNNSTAVLKLNDNEEQESSKVIPEIEKSNLSNALLQLKALGINSSQDLEYITSPPKDSINSALNELYEYGAISSPCDNEEGKITDDGITMSGIPIELCYSRMLIKSSKFNSKSCFNDVLTIISILSSAQDLDSFLSSPAAKGELLVDDSDHLTLIKIYNSLISNSASKEWCTQNQINYEAIQRIKQIIDLLLNYTSKLSSSLSSSSSNDNNQNIKKSLLSGLYKNVAKLSADGQYYQIKDESNLLHINPTSVLINLPQLPEYLLYSNIINSNDKKYMKFVTVIDSKWLSK